jgi:hypothetical protein
MCSIVYVFRQRTRKLTVLDRIVASIARILSPLNFLLNQFTDFPKYLSCATFSNDLFAIYPIISQILEVVFSFEIL